MLNNINKKNIINSFYLGLFIGICVQLFVGKGHNRTELIVGIMSSGIIGLFIGLITEILTALLPMTLAKVKTYFFVNNLIAVFVTLVIFTVGRYYFGESISSELYVQMLFLIVLLIIFANILDYFIYKHTNRKLEKFKASRK